MQPSCDIAVDKKLVHKKNPENVLIKNLRRSIPALIDRHTAENIIIPELSLPDRAVFLEYYMLHKPGHNAVTNVEQPETYDQVPPNSECYVLFNIPHIIHADLFEKDGSILKKYYKYLLNYYTKNEKQNCYMLKINLSESDESKIQEIMVENGISISDYEKFTLYRLLEPIENFQKENIFYSELLVDKRHTYFFEHAQEHVPGMMIMEAARQFALACCHVFGKTPLKGTQSALNKFNASFIDYTDLHYPVSMKLEFSKLERGKNGEWKSYIALISVCQKNAVCSEFVIDGRILSTVLFSRFREGRNKTNPYHRFYPVDPNICPVSLWDPCREMYMSAKLLDISLDGFSIETAELQACEMVQIEYEFIMHFHITGFIRGRCTQKWGMNENGNFYGGFHINNILKADKDNLKEAIKMFCHLRNDRKIN